MNAESHIKSVFDWFSPVENRPFIIAGPCSAETEEQILSTAAALKSIRVNMFRAGIWKPRTHPDTFEGVGKIGLEWLKQVKKQYEFPICTEAATAYHAEQCLTSGIDMIWIGARTVTNPFLVQEIAEALQGTDIPVFVKNPVNPDLELWVGALERLQKVGINKIGVIHRGFSTAEEHIYRNSPIWRLAVEFRSRFPELPFIVDPSHISGNRKYIETISQKALDLGLDGLMIESHCHPESALSDAKQQVTPAELKEILSNLIVRTRNCSNPIYKENIDQLRAEIDLIDENLLTLLKDRMGISRKIGKYKKENNIVILQTERWENLLNEMLKKAKEYNLPEDYVRSLFNIIHEASISAQDKD